MKKRHNVGKACKWRASKELMELMDAAINGSSPASFQSLFEKTIEEAKAERPDQLGLRPIPVFPYPWLRKKHE
jgi:hypothetical protein